MSGTATDAPVDKPAADTKPAETTTTTEQPSTETKTESTILGGDGKAAGAEGKPVDSATTTTDTPITYDIKAPEGVDLDTVAVDSFIKDVATKHKLTNEQAQAIVEHGIKRQAELQAAADKAQAEQIAREEKAEHDELKKDPVLGGANYEQTLKQASQAFLKFATKEEVEFINSTRLGNRVAMIKLFHRVYQGFAEDTSVQRGSSQPAKGDRDELRELYPNSPEMFGDTKE